MLGAQVVPEITGCAYADHELAQLRLDEAQDDEFGAFVLQQRLQREFQLEYKVTQSVP